MSILNESLITKFESENPEIEFGNWRLGVNVNLGKNFEKIEVVNTLGVQKCPHRPFFTIMVEDIRA